MHSTYHLLSKHRKMTAQQKFIVCWRWKLIPRWERCILFETLFPQRCKWPLPLNLGHFLSHKSNFIENLPNFPQTKETCSKKKKNIFVPHRAHFLLHFYPFSCFPSINVSIFFHIESSFAARQELTRGALWEKRRDQSLCNGSWASAATTQQEIPQCSVCFSITGYQQQIVLQHQFTRAHSIYHRSVNDPTGNNSFI